MGRNAVLNRLNLNDSVLHIYRRGEYGKYPRLRNMCTGQANVGSESAGGSHDVPKSSGQPAGTAALGRRSSRLNGHSQSPTGSSSSRVDDLEKASPSAG